MKSTAFILIFAIVAFVASEKIVHNFKTTENGTIETQKWHKGDQIELNFSENQTTGYQWMIPEEIEGYNLIWSLNSSTYVTDKHPEGMVGVGGTRTFVLDINDTGSEIVTFVYGRPWLYNNTMAAYNATGNFDASIMEGNAVQLEIQSTA